MKETQELKEIDFRIISMLQDNAGQSYGDIAKELSVSEGTIYNRITRLKKSGIIRKFIADIDFSKLGYDLDVVMGVLAEGNMLQQMEQDLAIEPNINKVYEVTGDYNLILSGKFKDRESLNGLIKRISGMPNVKRVLTLLVMNTVKDRPYIDIHSEKKRRNVLEPRQ
ncbi:MAG: Lrp/AsnC family transcriptional regulator [Candidatus Altiarchaeota archaeon]|nr:Lrp/AsnC family transcriptional regulator [Candidatus Altiarchaeota archaeon]